MDVLAQHNRFIVWELSECKSIKNTSHASVYPTDKKSIRRIRDYYSLREGIATNAVAAELGLSSASVRQARSRVMRQLRQQLGDLM